MLDFQSAGVGSTASLHGTWIGCVCLNGAGLGLLSDCPRSQKQPEAVWLLSTSGLLCLVREYGLVVATPAKPADPCLSVVDGQLRWTLYAVLGCEVVVPGTHLREVRSCACMCRAHCTCADGVAAVVVWVMVSFLTVVLWRQALHWVACRLGWGGRHRHHS